VIEDDLLRAHVASGECPSAEVLLGYAHGRLTAADRARVQAHVVTCGECELLAQSLRTLEEPDWNRVEVSLRPEKRFRFVRWMWGPVPGYVLAVVLAVVLVVQRKPTVAERPTPPTNPKLDVASLVHLAPDERGAGDVPRVAPGSVGSVVFTFFIPVRTGATYSAGIVDSQGNAVLRAVEIRSADGQFFVSCPGSVIQPGSYRLLVTEVGTETRTFQMSFTR
jgi:hypothetical protein